ncbi:MAG TPA: aminofutalosine synthase MqnE [Deltaproteobacteria bacterium]|jgi:aminodeoxyfutalosine synthase|nr:aminofutalosine synthase MqnE [Deltaproteobacteria bacterium]
MFEPRYFKKLGLEDISHKVAEGERLTVSDGERLFACPDMNAIGSLAHQVRTRLHGNTAYYVVNRHINYSNICVNGCRFCAFSRKKGDPLSFELSEDEILDKICANGNGLTEVHIVGGCHPDLALSFFEDLVRKIRVTKPNVFIKAFTAVEIAHFAKNEGTSVKDVLARLKSAGVQMLPGGGAEVFSARVRERLCPEKLDGNGWLDVMRQAHEIGIRTNATMLYGHIETVRERLEHMAALRELQDRTGGFVCFIPLTFQPANTGLSHLPPATGVDDLKTIAVSRLMIDNIAHIKAYWVMLSVKLAQAALYFGADDFDGTVVEEKIGHMAGAESQQGMTRREIERTIRDAGLEPVERDGLFRKVFRSPASEGRLSSGSDIVWSNND